MTHFANSVNRCSPKSRAVPQIMRSAAAYHIPKREVMCMTMAIVWTLFVTASLVCGAVYGTLADVTAAAMEGASAAVELTLSMAGALCLWSGVMTVLERGGLTAGLARLFRPLLRRILPCASRDADTLAAVSANVSANLLGLGNAATPLGIEAVRRMERKSPGTASDAMCMLVVCNTASIQLIPTTVASVRAAAGSSSPFDILPAVWLASALSVGVGITACKLFARIWRD